MRNRLFSLLDHIEYVYIIPLVYRLVKKNYRLRCKLYDYIDRRFPIVSNDGLEVYVDNDL